MPRRRARILEALRKGHSRAAAADEPHSETSRRRLMNTIGALVVEIAEFRLFRRILHAVL
jgi:hypothetical protein